MKKILNLLKKHWQEDFDLTYYGCVAMLLAAGLLVNYTIGLENNILDKDPGNPLRIIWYFLLYGVAYYSAFFLMVFFKKRKALGLSQQFWIVSLAGLLILSINSGFPFVSLLLNQFDLDYKIFLWMYSISNNTIGFVVVTLPLLLYAFLTRHETRLLGLNPSGVDLQPYFLLLGIVLPVILIASFETGFQNYYPTYKSYSVADILHCSEWIPMAIYELVYGLDFFNTEFFFRGLLVIGLAQWLGKDAIMPMVVTYCFLHFGKPVGEAIGSIAGGYVLGVIAYYTRSIWGGVILHIGIAWMMELFAYLQKVF